MVGPDALRRAWIGALGALLLGGLAACSTHPEPKALPPQTAVAKPEPEQAPPAELPVAAPAKSDTTVMIDDGGAGPKAPQTLAEASAAERERRQKAGKPIAVINDKNLKSYAKGSLTTAEVPAAKGEASPAPGVVGAPGQDESYWRTRGHGIRARWRDAVDEMATQQKEADRLRNQFYAADDPYYRDSRIKPAWDRALDLLSKARKDADAAKTELEVFLDEGQRAAVPAAWLRDGQEVEPEDGGPEPAKKKPPQSQEPVRTEPREPVMLDQKPPRR